MRFCWGWLFSISLFANLFASAALGQHSPDFEAQVEETISGLLSSITRVVPEQPVPVGLGIKLMQIVDVDQQAENFTVVARIRAVWSDPALGFETDEAAADIRTMTQGDFERFVRDRNLLAPLSIFENVQGRTFTKSSNVLWNAQGDAFAAGEYVLKLQAPDFNFRKYPFDTQEFYIRVLLGAPAPFFNVVPLEDFSGLDPVLGEEEWIITEHWTEVDTAEAVGGWQAARFSLGLRGERHLTYYWMRIFMPLLLLSLVSWANLFLEEYRRRIDIAGANLLAFIAFSFTISGDLPRLGYVTFLDALLMAMFLLAAASVGYNVMLRRLSITERDARARAIDWHVTYWGYPLANIALLLALVSLFLR
ncbi:MAG: hypothetical protein AAF678_08770 [Pseudomonadota bacterium]